MERSHCRAETVPTGFGLGFIRGAAPQQAVWHVFFNDEEAHDGSSPRDVCCNMPHSCHLPANTMSNTAWTPGTSVSTSGHPFAPISAITSSAASSVPRASSKDAQYHVERLMEVESDARDTDSKTESAPDPPSVDEGAESDEPSAAAPSEEHPADEAPAEATAAADPEPLRVGVWVDEQDRFGFVDAVIKRLPERFDVATFHTFRAGIEDQVRADLDRVDLAWFEWAEGDTLDIANYTAQKPLLCRVHPNIANTDREQDIRFEHVDHWMFAAPGTQRSFESRYGGQIGDAACSTVPTGVDVDTIGFDPRKAANGHIALYAPLGPEDNPTLLLQVLAGLVEQDEQFNVHITGAAQHPGIAAYVRHQAEALGIDDHIHFYGAVTAGERDVWLDQCTYVLSTRMMDGDWTGVVEAMARGLKPIIHAFPGAEQLFAPNMLFHTVDEAVEQFVGDDPQPEQYRRFVQRRYSIDRAVTELTRAIDRLAAEYYPEQTAAYLRAQREQMTAPPAEAPEATLQEARAAVEEGDVDAAAERLEQLAFDQLAAEARLEARVLALRIAMARTAFTDALFHADAALDLAPDEPLLLHLIGQALWAQNHQQAAADALIYAAELLDAEERADREHQFEVNAAQVYFMAGEVCEHLQQPAEARHFFEHAQQHAPEEEQIQQALDRVRPMSRPA